MSVNPPYLESLQALGLLVKESPIETRFSRKGIYRIADPLYRFWYRFVGPLVSLVENGMGDKLYADILRPEWPAFLGPVFEGVCRDYRWRKNKDPECPVKFSEIGRWWGETPNPARKRKSIWSP